jgi:hypothetical protein
MRGANDEHRLRHDSSRTRSLLQALGRRNEDLSFMKEVVPFCVREKFFGGCDEEPFSIQGSLT